MIKQIIIINILFLIFTSSVSCDNKINNAYNLNTTIFVDTVGLDYNQETQKYTLYYHSPSSFSLITSEMGSGTTENNYHIAKAECTTIYDGIKEIAANTERSVLLSHVRSFVLSENFITIDNLKMFNEFVKTYKYMTCDFAVYATDDEIEKVFSFTNPDNNSYYSILTELDEVVPYKIIKYYEFANSIAEKHIPIILQWIKIDDNVWSTEKDQLTSIHLEGIYLIDENNILKLSSKEYKFILLLYNNYYTVLTVDNISYTLVATNIKVNDQRVKVSSDVYSTNVKEQNSLELIAKLEKYIIEEFNKLYKITSENNFDLFYIQDSLYRKGKLKDDFQLETITFEYKLKLKLLN